MEGFMAYNFNINKIVLATFVPPHGGTPIHTNRSSHGIVLHIDGERHYVFGNTKLTARRGDIVYLPKGSDYEVKTVNTGGCYAINFDVSEEVVFQPFVRRIKNYDGFLKYFRQAEIVWRSKISGYEMQCKSELYSIICKIRREYDAGYVSGKTSEAIRNAVLYIHNEYTNGSISISHLASLCNMSETYFRKIFRQTFGISPVKYINNLKLTRARELLASGMYSVSQAAAMSGFPDECYFSRKFFRDVGVNPSEFRAETDL